jgi:hypothetical protein
MFGRQKANMATRKITVAIPASFISDTPHLREKTSKVGMVGRAASIFRINEIIVYKDDPAASQGSDLNLITSLLSYMETPQYLRRKLFKLEPQLQYAGILPPLRTPHHPLTRTAKDLKVGDHREGVVLSKTRDGALVDIGFEEPALLAGRQFTVGKRITLRITKVGGPVEAAIANPREIKDYWGYTVSEAISMRRVVESGNWDLKIATSKKGDPFERISKRLAESWREAKNILLLFGAPTRGLIEIARDEGTRLDEITDFVVNTIPNQGTETVRTEEAILASLAIMNVHFGF